MSRPIIDIREISKRYQLGAIGATSLRDELSRLWARARGGAAPHQTSEFWALRDVSFDVQPGEVIGIIGRNGAGKSTLLKILSRITRQTSGEITLRGRVASLLEVGTGFHPDLTGRENIFLNGAILGMTKAEIRKKFDEIVAFAEIDQFIDTPVKRYSSGMYVRLAFAVAAHLEPEILIVDEVLAVGDAAFQKKCLGKMGDVASQDGRTVLFVSHNMAAVQALCTRAVLLEAGQAVANSDARAVVNRYLTSLSERPVIDLELRTDRQGDGSVRLTSAAVAPVDASTVITCGSALRFTFGYRAAHRLSRPRFQVGVYTDEHVGVFGLDTDVTGDLPDALPPSGVLTCVTSPIDLTAGPCFVNVDIYNGGNLADFVPQALRFTVEPDDFYGTGRAPTRGWVTGLVRHAWSVA